MQLFSLGIIYEESNQSQDLVLLKGLECQDLEYSGIIEESEQIFHMPRSFLLSW